MTTPRQRRRSDQEKGQLSWCSIPSPIGPLVVVSSVRGLSRIVVGGEPSGSLERWAALHFPGAELVESASRNQMYIGELNRYFDRTLERFESPLDLKGSDFQLLVWTELRKIPYGSTVTYGELARRIGLPQAQQAVGRANATNPVPIVVPCHRVLGSRNRLEGFAAGVAVKEYLLRHEGALLL